MEVEIWLVLLYSFNKGKYGPVVNLDRGCMGGHYTKKERYLGSNQDNKGGRGAGRKGREGGKG